MTLAIMLAGGGTGGHVFPLIAIAEALRSLSEDCRLLFVGTRRGLEASIVPAKGYSLEFLDIRPIRGVGPAGAMRGAARAILSLPESLRLLRSFLPDIVLSVGGYAAGPVTLAAWAEGIPTALLEPNSEMGLSNRCLASLVDRAYTAFESVERHFSASRVLRAGVPLRAGFSPRPWIAHDGPLRLLVLGGSQGASALNESVPAAVSSVQIPIEVKHQCGNAHVERVHEIYKKLRQPEVSVVPFIEDMPAALEWADIVVSRSGASAVSEISAVGRASLLIPYPFAAGAHQYKNAMALAESGAAICLDSKSATPDNIRERLVQLARDTKALAQMSQASRRLGRPNAASMIAQDLLEIAGAGQVRGNQAGTSNRSAPQAEV
jgi:UDP-N-acetylglucosamine--N-acetylmuramyl-(pentapeptide) pyrophosphoryl-undecaprenol N-acetylglucosamine transferase